MPQIIVCDHADRLSLQGDSNSFVPDGERGDSSDSNLE